MKISISLKLQIALMAIVSLVACTVIGTSSKSIAQNERTWQQITMPCPVANVVPEDGRYAGDRLQYVVCKDGSVYDYLPKPTSTSIKVKP